MAGAEKRKILYHSLFSALLLHDKQELRMFLRMNTETYDVSKFVFNQQVRNSVKERGRPRIVRKL